MTKKPDPEGAAGWETATWKGSRRLQLARWADLSLDEILDAQEEMAETAERLLEDPVRPHKVAEPQPGLDREEDLPNHPER